MAEIMINKDLQEKLNALIQKTVTEEGKLKEDLNCFHNNKANLQKKKKKKKYKKEKYVIKTVQYNSI